MYSNEIFWNDLLISFSRFVLLVTIIPIGIALYYRNDWNRPLFIFFLYCLIIEYIYNDFELWQRLDSCFIASLCP